MNNSRLRSPLSFRFVSLSGFVTVGAIALLGLVAPGCGSSSPSTGTGGTAGHTAVGGHSGATGGAGGSAGGSSGSSGGAAGSIASGGGSSGTGGAGGQMASAGGAAGGASTGGMGGGAVGTAGAAGGTTATGGAGGKSATGGAGGAAATGGAGGTGTTGPGKVGIVALSETTMTYTLPAPIGQQTIVASGAVASYVLPGTPANCPAPTTVGSCQLFPGCSSTSTGTTQVSAGSVSITGLAVSPIALNTIASTNGYMSTAYTSYLWNASVPTTVTVSGTASVPAYTMDINTPNPIAITAPVPTGSATTGSTYAFSKSSDLVVSWTGGAQGQVVVGLANMGTAPNAAIACSVAASAGTVTIPASLMSGFGTMAGFTSSVTTSATKMVNDWLMEFQATAGAAVGTVTFSN